MTITRLGFLAVFTAVCVLGASGVPPARSFDGEGPLYEAAKKEKELTWYTAHYDSETAAALCAALAGLGAKLR